MAEAAGSRQSEGGAGRAVSGPGLVQVYTGDGKGKTTAALGLALRAAGRGMRVLILQFLKGRDTGELHSLAALSPQVRIEQFGTGEFTGECDDGALRRRTRDGLAEARRALGGDYDLVILDEALVAAKIGYLGVDEVLALAREKAPYVELVLTGRGAAEEIVAAADLVTYMQEVKHPFQRGIEARRGLDF